MTIQEKEVLRGMYVKQVVESPNYSDKITTLHLAINQKQLDLASELIGILAQQHEPKVINKEEAASLWGELTYRVGNKPNFTMAIASVDFDFKEGELQKDGKDNRANFYMSTAIYRLAQTTLK